jgi:threonine 3-dehydrogenase
MDRNIEAYCREARMTAKMKALVKSKPEPGLWLEEVPIPDIGINDVLVKIDKTAICGTDVHIYNWNEWAQKTIPVPMPADAGGP